MTDDWHTPEIDKPKDLSDDINFKGVLNEYADQKDGSIGVKLEHDVIVQRVAKEIYTKWSSGVRELLTNELKACQLARDNFNAHPNIVVSINPTERSLVIQGFDSLGITAKKFGEVVRWLGRTHNKDRGSIGMFGMGIESYTTLSETLKIETNPRETDIPYSVLGRQGMTWLELDENNHIPYGTKLSLTLDKELGDTKFFKELYNRIEEVLSLHDIPSTIEIVDEIDDDDDKWAMGKSEVELLDKQHYLINKIHKEEEEDRYRYSTLDISSTKAFSMSCDEYDITLLVGKNSGIKGIINEDMHFYTTLINVPIDNELTGSQICSRINDMRSYLTGSLRDMPEFAGLLINLKDEKMFPPVASRDQLVDGWLLDSMLKDTYDLACEWYDEHEVSDLNDMFNMDHHDRMAWQHLKKSARDSNDVKTKLKEEDLQKCMNLSFAIYKEGNKRHNHISFFDILSHNRDGLNYDKLFYMSNFYRDKIAGIDEQLDDSCSYIKLSDPKFENKETLEYLLEFMKERQGVNDSYIIDTKQWLKTRKVKIKIKRIPRPKGSVVWHYNNLSNHSYYGNEISSYNRYTKDREDSYSIKNLLKKKNVRLQLSNKLYGGNKLSIADIVRVLESIPTDIMFCKADTEHNAHSVDDYIKGVLNRKVDTSQGSIIVSDMLDKHRTNDGLSIKFLYYPYPEVILNKCFNADKNILYVCSKNNDELVGMSLAFMTDGYLNNHDWSITYDDKSMVEFGYDNEIEINDKLKAKMNKDVLSMLSTKGFVARWSKAEHRGCMILGMVDLVDKIPTEYYSDMMRSLTYCDNYDSLVDNIKRIRGMFNA